MPCGNADGGKFGLDATICQPSRFCSSSTVELRLVGSNSVCDDPRNVACNAPGSLDTSLSHAAGLIEIAACHA